MSMLEIVRRIEALERRLQELPEVAITGTYVPVTRTLTAGAGLTGGGDLSADRTFAVGAGLGITVNADDVALTTPGSLAVATTNSSIGSHTHAITTSSSPGAAAAILATPASGELTLLLQTVGGRRNRGAGTSFPASPVNLDEFLRTDWRALFIYEAATATWHQISVGSFTGAFPASPSTDLRAYRVDRDLEYYWDGTRWLGTQLLPMTISDIRNIPSPYAPASVSAAPTYTVLMAAAIHDAASIYIERCYQTANVVAPNDAASFWEGELDFTINGGATTSLLTWSTSGLAAATTHRFSSTPAAAFTTSAAGGFVRMRLRKTGTAPAPGTLSSQWVVEYRKVG